MVPAPVVLFAYNRPEHLRRLIESLDRNTLAPETDLIVYCDGPRNEAASADVAAVRAIARSIQGFRSVDIVERQHNLGLARSVVEGVSRTVAARGSVIVLEDDLLVAPRFLEFMNLALNEYAGNPSVMQISGFQFDLKTTDPDECVFLPIISCWGWATWSRAWRAFDSNAEAYGRLKTDPSRRKRFDLDDSYDYSGLLERQQRGEVDSWGIRWYLSVFDRDGLVLYPSRSLVTNTGFDGSGTHGVANDGGLASGVTGGSPYAFRFLRREGISAQALDEVKKILREARKGPIARMLGRFGW